MSIPKGVPQSPTWLRATTPVPGEAVQARQGVADHRGAQVPDVHLLGHVGRGVVDHHAQRLGRGGDAQARVVHQGTELGVQESGGQRQVEESGAGDLDGGEVGQVQARRDLGGDVARGAVQRLGQRHDAVGLVVAALGVTQHRVRPRGEGVERDGEPREQGVVGGRHVNSLAWRARRTPGAPSRPRRQNGTMTSPSLDSFSARATLDVAGRSLTYFSLKSDALVALGVDRLPYGDQGPAGEPAAPRERGARHAPATSRPSRAGPRRPRATARPRATPRARSPTPPSGS